MALVVTAANAVLFLAAWEIMSLSSFLLVAFEHDRAEVRRAAWIYLLATHLGTAFLFALFLLAGTRTGSFDFASFGALSALPPASAALLFLFAVVGFGTKAGLFPLHVWLPDAHPAAPSHVSALMSGIMIKTGIYGILRMLTFLPPAPAWWGALLMALGIGGALFGIALAALQRDIKRCLAYSTVENVGIMFLAFGLSIFASARGLPAVAAVALAGGLLHLWNHALFKGLLFLGAGSLMHGTGSRDLDRMGGLLRRMPFTGALLVGGSLAISALPPLNGFVGEWLIYLGLLQAGASAGGLAGLWPFVLVGLLGLVGGLAALVFTRLIGIALLGQPRSAEADRAHESSWAMTLPMTFLLALCLAIGLFPDAVLRLVQLPVGRFVPVAASGFQPAMVAVVGRIALLLLALLVAAWFGLARLRASRPRARGATWGCGYVLPSSRMAYTAEGYSELGQRHLLPGWLRPLVSGGRPSGLFPSPENLRQEAPDPVLQRLYLPFFADVARRCWRLRWLQQGKLHVYLMYIFLTCAVLMAWVVLAERGWPW
jgi:formate hydrogenlyase subunit 3/multisubunit Na+/H+ antiporter MnhD subunit